MTEHKHFEMPDNMAIRCGILAGMSLDGWYTLSGRLYATREMYDRQRIIGDKRLILSDVDPINTKVLNLSSTQGMQSFTPLHIVIDAEDNPFEDIKDGVARVDDEEHRRYRQILREKARSSLVLAQRFPSSVYMDLLTGTKQGSDTEDAFIIAMRLLELGYRGRISFNKGLDANEVVAFDDFRSRIEFYVNQGGEWGRLEKTLRRITCFDLKEIQG